MFIGPLWLQTERLRGSGGGVGRGGCPETSEEATAKSRLFDQGRGRGQDQGGGRGGVER